MFQYLNITKQPKDNLHYITTSNIEGVYIQLENDLLNKYLPLVHKIIQ